MRKFFYNLYNLLNALRKFDIYWMATIMRKERSIIDGHARIYPPYDVKDTTIGFGTYLSTNSKISYSSIGKFCSIGPNLICGWGIHPTNGISTSPAFYSIAKQNGFTYSKENKVEERKKITIGNDVFIGANVVVLDGITIGDGAVIGAGAVVSKNIPPYAIAVGCPIRILRYRFEEDLVNKLLEIKWWDRDEAFYKKVEACFWDVELFIKEADNFDK